MKYYAENILLSDGWATDTTITIDNGIITAITSGKSNYFFHTTKILL